MLDMKFIRENKEKVIASLNSRGSKNFDLNELIKLDEEKRKLLTDVEALKHKKNDISEKIAEVLRNKKSPEDLKSSSKELTLEIDKIDSKVGEITKKIDEIVLTIPNIPHETVPIGTPEANKVVREWGEKKVFNFTPRNHLEIAEHLDIIDLPRASKITGANFILFKGIGARLERALYNYMLDLHTQKHGYFEIFPPFLVNRASMIGTGQLPKLEEDMYKVKDDDLFLIPTAEVPVTNMHRDETLTEEELPLYYTAYTACFRREAGSYGKDTKGITRVHQFDKVELVKFVKPENSFDELEKLVADAEDVLRSLGLAYRVVLLATGDISFSASKCYDIELWAPGAERYLEVSSCSNFTDFQARRANIRFKRSSGKKTEFVHTLNGSGVALARLVIAILENYQQKDGSVIIPEKLRPYMDGREYIQPVE